MHNNDRAEKSLGRSRSGRTKEQKELRRCGGCLPDRRLSLATRQSRDAVVVVLGCLVSAWCWTEEVECRTKKKELGERLKDRASQTTACGSVFHCDAENATDGPVSALSNSADDLIISITPPPTETWKRLGTFARVEEKERGET